MKMSALDHYLAAARSSLVLLEPADAYAATQRGALLVDIRPEFQRRRDGEVPAAIIVERNHLEWRLHPDSPARIPEATSADVEWIVLCDQGYASSLAAAVLQALGLRRATDVVGGFQAWRAAGLPLGPPGKVSERAWPWTQIRRASRFAIACLSAPG
jgi:rhodanese-related sulfurtransferase